MKLKILSTLGFLLVSGMVVSHPRHTDPILGELNDYLMALQVLRSSSTEAERLFQLWLEVREGSWKIRELTENGGLSSNHSDVKQVVRNTHSLRRSLRDQCLVYFEARKAELPAAAIEVSDQLLVQWSEPLIRAQVGERKPVLLELKNKLREPVTLQLSGSRDSEILFWKQSILIEPGSRRFCFAFIAASQPGMLSSEIRIQAGDSASATVTIRAEADSLAPANVRKAEPGKSIRFRISDAKTGEPLPVRVEVQDGEGKSYWEPLLEGGYAVTEMRYGRWETSLWPYQPGPHFYLDGSKGVLGVEPAGKTVGIYHGFEYLPARIAAPDDGTVQVEMHRWINMEERGWYPGQTHIHTTDQGLPVPFFESWPLISAAEGLSVSHILTLKGEWTSHAIYADEYPMGPVPSNVAKGRVVAYGEEYRNNPYGHLCFLGLDELIQPISSGALGELGGPDYPPNLFVLEEALAQDATTVGAHFGLSILEENPIKTPWPSTGFEMPIDVALGKIHVAEIYGNGGQLSVWYRLLNCGFEIAGTAGPDWVLKDTPRTYVYLGDVPLTVDSWTERLRQGQSFVTHGPMVFLTVDGERPGTRLNYPEPTRRVQVKADALGPDGSLPLEIVVNGEVVAEGVNLDTTLTIEDSAWIAARTEEAHSNPVYVTLQGRPRGYAEAAEAFIGVADRLSDWVSQKAIFENDDQQRTVLRVIAQGRAVYEGIARRAKELGRRK
jgi:hypothetical protein